MAPSGRSSKAFTEASRQREAYKYFSAFAPAAVFKQLGGIWPDGDLVTAEDTALTAFAQLSALQTGTARSFISIFDERYQYVIAEATPALPLVPSLSHDNRHGQELWLCGNAIDRRDTVCEFTLCAQDDTPQDPKGGQPDLPVTVVPDLAAHPQLSTKKCYRAGDLGRFYAGVPIRSARDINIGVLCVIDVQPRHDWNDLKAKTLSNISRAVMRHLEGNRAKGAHRRSERMNRGLGSFVEDKATISGWKHGPYAAAFADDANLEGALNPKQQDLQTQEDILAEQAPHTSPESLNERNLSLERRESETRKQPNSDSGDHHSSVRSSSPPLVLKHGEEPEPGTFRQNVTESVYSRAANIIRESIEVEGCVFLDASKTSFGALSGQQTGQDEKTSSDSTTSSSRGGANGNSSSSDEGNLSPTAQQTVPSASVLGFSTSEKSSIDDQGHFVRQGVMAERFVSAMLRRYPKGKIFSFDESGELQSSDYSEEDRSQPTGSTPASPTEERQSLEMGAVGHKSQRKPWARENEGRYILKMFPGARSVAFVPVWNPRKRRWFSAGFAYTYAHTRIFSVEGELSYLRAFGTLAMAETMRQEMALEEKAKSDALSSLSHELRSPLHGIILGIEMLNDTSLSVTQGDIVHTLETCGRTLTDTLDHLLDFSKINNFMTSSGQQQGTASGGRGVRQGTANTMEAGMINLTSVVRLDRLAEEVIESVFAGFNFQQKSIAQLAQRKKSSQADVTAHQTLDTMRADLDLGRETANFGQVRESFGDVSIFFVADPKCAWTFYTQPGAVRRIIMNLFGNALKHTQKGTIRVTLEQKASSRAAASSQEQAVTITVADTGSGMSDDFRRNELFKPFAQENHLSPGTGLGLSLVKQMTSQLRGRVSVKSALGVGTTVTVTVPMMPLSSSTTSNPETSAATDQDEEFAQQVKQLRGLRICLLGFNGHRLHLETADTGKPILDGLAMIRSICRDWLDLEVVSDSAEVKLAPDLILCTEDALPLTHGQQQSKDETLTKSPALVVCANAIVAYERSSSLQADERSGIVEFISQPLGAHKLARMLLLLFRRWTELQKPEDKSEGSGRATPDITSTPQSGVITANTKTPTRDAEGPQPTRDTRPLEMRPKPSPLGTASVSETRVSQQQLKPESPTGRGPSGTSGRKDGFLLVDDNYINLKMLCTYMNKLGLAYRTATNGQEAVDAYKQDPTGIKCILMDISMPVMDGFEASRQIRGHEKEREKERTKDKGRGEGEAVSPALILALTGLASLEAQKEGFASGVDLFLAKPVKLKELESILRSKGLLGEGEG